MSSGSSARPSSGFARAQFSLGLLHERGEHVPRSQTEATAWFRKAAEQGWRDAQLALATQYFLGRGAPRDYAEAARWYERAAEQGDAGAAYIVASMYEKGDGVEQSISSARCSGISRPRPAAIPVADIKAREMLRAAAQRR